MRALFSIDPGGTTGVAMGVFDVRADSVRDALEGGLCKRSLDVGGRSAGRGSVTEAEQAVTLLEEFRAFRHEVAGLGLSDVQLVIEDWTPRLPLKSGERVVFYPVRIPCLLLGMLYVEDGGVWPDVVWQSASVAKRFATDERLRRWGAWVRGSDHQRDAWRHAAARLNVLLG